MFSYGFIIGCALVLPLWYVGMLRFVQLHLEEEKNRKRRILQSPSEWIVLVLAEAALLRIWFALRVEEEAQLRFVLLYVILCTMTVLCITDLWEKVVPNRILLVLTAVLILIVGGFSIADMNQVLKELPYLILGFLFCLIAFGMGYVLGRGSMGAGDVKLSLLMGFFLTSEYVVGAVLYGCIISAVYSLVQILRKKLSRKDTLPFVPFLYVGMIIRLMMG